ncbi:MAG: hypothetical protein HF308_18330 [Ignavibacteria bacterium]|jgi:hypothetical protein|nr:hypothetical protein [Ignavibacteria bacterium]MCU7526440.1 hypothetical protein [Ignavibacteria bacterium]
MSERVQQLKEAIECNRDKYSKEENDVYYIKILEDLFADIDGLVLNGQDVKEHTSLAASIMTDHDIVLCDNCGKPIPLSVARDNHNKIDNGENLFLCDNCIQDNITRLTIEKQNRRKEHGNQTDNQN